MPKGGARPRSGPPADPTSARSERRGATAAVQVTALPSEGYRGRAPAFPLPKIGRGLTADGRPDAAAATAFRKRELEIWRAQWKKPQAAAWAQESWRWDRIALYCRWTAVIEAEPDKNASLIARQREVAIEHGLTPDGMKANGWAIAANQVAQQAEKKNAGPAAKKTAPQRRLRAVSGSDSGT